MKSSNLIAIGAALAGFAIGWIAKPSGEAPAEKTAEMADAGKKPRAGMDSKSGDRSERPLVLKQRPSAKGSAERDPEISAAERNFQVSFSSAGERTNNARLNRLSEALGLSEEQKTAVNALLSGRREGFKDLKGKGKTPSEMVAEAGNSVAVFENALKDVLDDEQMQAYQDLKVRERQNDIEAKAATEFADLVRQVDLSIEQRDQAMEAMRKISEESFAKRPAGWELMSESMEMMGGLYNDAFENMSGFLDDPAVMGNPAEMQKRMNEAHRAASEQKVSRLTEILTPAQLQQFRATLDARSNFREISPVPPTPQR
ncbi:hypothetical protein OJ996_14895 [Luteolibacter sp. GHJ8]|uniref:LTXXQ motif family protein n=1 Tax=Luteolibacter rhizosphaerae TaxID=2989719 RepID=A0ABT3G4W6_9BACT|nr:hypothetical protein [Luteolibacter rhizosphaerae]MCW1914873.1 hypothetical protein [Luteolibacter rhizosphaerae]